MDSLTSLFIQVHQEKFLLFSRKTSGIPTDFLEKTQNSGKVVRKIV